MSRSIPLNVNPEISPEEAVARMPHMAIDHAVLDESLQLAMDFNNCEQPNKKAYFDKQRKDFVEAITGIDGVVGSFGTGYPFYATEKDIIHPIEELNRYIGSYRPLVASNEERTQGPWPCACCTEVNNLPDLKSVCKPCDRVDIKPRDIFKVLPDIDYWVIVDETTHKPEAVADKLVQPLENHGFYNSDRNHPAVIGNTVEAVEGVLAGEVPEARLPLDLHVVTLAEFVAAVCKVPQSVTGDREAPITPLSWHRQWEASETYDMSKDFLFSLTLFENCPDSLQQIVGSVRQSVRAVINDPVQTVCESAPKEARQLATPVIARLLLERVAQW